MVKLQELSIPYHTGTQSGRLQSKIMRDVEAVETLSSQLFVNLMNIIMNLVITLTITAVKNRIILLFFLLVAPVAAAAVCSHSAVKNPPGEPGFPPGNGGNQRQGHGDGGNGSRNQSPRAGG